MVAFAENPKYEQRRRIAFVEDLLRTASEVFPPGTRSERFLILVEDFIVCIQSIDSTSSAIGIYRTLECLKSIGVSLNLYAKHHQFSRPLRGITAEVRYRSERKQREWLSLYEHQLRRDENC